MLQAIKSPAVPHRLCSDSIQQVVDDQDLQLALLNCAAELVLNVFSSSLSFPVLTAQIGRLSTVIDLWAATEHFKVHLKDSNSADMPEDCLNLLGYMR